MGILCRTYTGNFIDPLDIREEDICISDIAHGLSNICRYNGQCNRFYSVAEHCVHVASLLPHNLKLAGLLHDATEAYYSDLSTALKHSVALEGYRVLEENLEQTINRAFGLKATKHIDIKAADVLVYDLEKRKLFGLTDETMDSRDEHPLMDWATDRLPVPAGFDIRCWRPEQAENAFLFVFDGLTKAERIAA